jgi:hypothetical protein
VCPETGVDFFLCKKIFLHVTRIESRTVQPVPSRCTDLDTTVCPSLDVMHTETVTGLHTVCKQYRQCTNNLNIEAHAMRMRHTGICGLPSSTILFHINPLTAGLSKKSYRTYNVCSDFSTTIKRDIIINVNRYSYSVFVILARF